jgi:tetratricopeptide (TPR) repeat protein
MARNKKKKRNKRGRSRNGSARPKISLCMIVRNEEEFLERCIRSARKAVDEIIVVDTGSEDNTIEIARKSGARVYSHPWENDFSKARNFSLDYATGDWVLYLDADEILTHDGCRRIRALAKSASAMGYLLIQRNYTDDPKAAGWRTCEPGCEEARGRAGWFPAPIVRLFRNHPEIRFEGAVHELVDYSVTRLGGRVEATDIAIHHYGKVRDLEYVKAKQELYLKLGEQKASGRPDDAKAHYELGVQYIELGVIDKCIEALTRSLELDPNQPKAHCDLGVALERSGRMEESANHYARALALDPQSGQAIINLGSAYARMGRMEEAEHLFDRALAACPNDPVALNNVGSKMFMQGKFDKAVALYRRAISASPSYAQAHFNLGTVYEKLGDLENARSSLERAIELNPAHHEALANLSVALMRMGLWRESEERCRKAIEIKPDDFVSHNNMGAILHQLGQAERGTEHVLEAVEMQPDYEPAQQNLAQLEKQCPQLVKAARAKKRAKLSTTDRRKRIVFYHRGMEFDGDTVSSKPLGGSESAVVYMARELARLDCEVFVFNSCREPKECHGVRYLPVSGFAEFAASQTADVFVAQRYWQPFLTDLRAGVKVYWVQDAHDQPFVQGLRDIELAERIDRIFTISEWQTRMFCSEFGLERSKFHVTRNGFRPELFESNGVARNPYRMAYASTPFRGLDVLLDVFPEIRKAVPEAELRLFTSMAVYGVGREEDEAQYGDLYERTRQPGVTLMGSVPQETLARELSECALMVYPNHFAETSCIAAIEAQAAGAPVVTTQLGALPETVVGGVTGICIPGDGKSPEYRQTFVEKTVALLKDPARLAKMSEAARARAFERYPWGRIAEEWLIEFDRIAAEKEQSQLAKV